MGDDDLDIHDVAGSGDLERFRDAVARDPRLVRRMNAQNASPLHVAAADGQTAIVADILSLTTEGVNDRDCDGQTPLYLAARGGHADCVHALLKAGASPNIPDSHGYTPLAKAAMRSARPSMQAIVRDLLSTGAERDILAMFLLDSPSVLASWVQSNKAIVASYPLRNDLLRVAIASESAELVTELVNLGLNVHAVGADGVSIVEFARRVPMSTEAARSAVIAALLPPASVS